jgi:hypothetical protein
MECRIEDGSAYLKPPKKWALLARVSSDRIGWDVIGAYETKQEARAMLAVAKNPEAFERLNAARRR